MPFGLRLGTDKRQDIEQSVSLEYAGHSSADWVSYSDADPASLTTDPFFSRSDLHQVTLTFDGVGTLIGAHLIYTDYAFNQLGKALAEKYGCVAEAVAFFGNDSASCTLGDSSFTAYFDHDSGWSHVLLQAEGPAEGRKPDVE